MKKLSTLLLALLLLSSAALAADMRTGEEGCLRFGAHLYCVEADGLYRQSGELSDGLERLADVSMDGSLRFFVGRNRLAEFYHMILPRFREIAQVAPRMPGRSADCSPSDKILYLLHIPMPCDISLFPLHRLPYKRKQFHTFLLQTSSTLGQNDNSHATHMTYIRH